MEYKEQFVQYSVVEESKRVVSKQNDLEGIFEVSTLAVMMKLSWNVYVMVCEQKSRIPRVSWDHHGNLQA